MELLHTVVAVSSPLAYFAFTDLLCCKAPDWAGYIGEVMLPIKGLLTLGGQEQLLASWQHNKAFGSACASWSKASMAILKVESSSPSFTSSMGDFADIFSNLLHSWSGGLWQGGNTSSNAGLQPASLQTIPLSIHLTVLLWLSRVILVTSDCFLGLTPAAIQLSNSGCGGDGGVDGAAGSSSSSGSSSNVTSSSSCKSARAAITAQEGSVVGEGGTLGAAAFPARECVAGSFLRAILPLRWNLSLWNRIATGRMVEASSDSSGDGASAAAAAAAVQLPKRLEPLPLHGFPRAVENQLQHITRMFGVEAQPGAPEQQLLLLQELLLLAKLLLQEVPLPLGCSNLTCLSLTSMSEVALAHNPCSGCRVARYCSRECQVAHWEQHKGLCKQLQKGKGKGQQEQQGVQMQPQGVVRSQEEDSVKQQRKQAAICGNSGCSKSAADVRLRPCIACNTVRYCSRECQVAHWKVHKASCKQNDQQK